MRTAPTGSVVRHLLYIASFMAMSMLMQTLMSMLMQTLYLLADL